MSLPLTMSSVVPSSSTQSVSPAVAGRLSNQTPVTNITNQVAQKTACCKALIVAGIVASCALAVLGAAALAGLALMTFGSSFVLAGLVAIAVGKIGIIPAWVAASAAAISGIAFIALLSRKGCGATASIDNLNNPAQALLNPVATPAAAPVSAAPAVVAVPATALTSVLGVPAANRMPTTPPITVAPAVVASTPSSTPVAPAGLPLPPAPVISPKIIVTPPPSKPASPAPSAPTTPTSAGVSGATLSVALATPKKASTPQSPAVQASPNAYKDGKFLMISAGQLKRLNAIKEQKNSFQPTKSGKLEFTLSELRDSLHVKLGAEIVQATSLTGKTADHVMKGCANTAMEVSFYVENAASISVAFSKLNEFIAEKLALQNPTTLVLNKYLGKKKKTNDAGSVELCGVTVNFIAKDTNPSKNRVVLK